MSQPPAIRTEALARAYKISESKVDEPKELVAHGIDNEGRVQIYAP
ncbi:MAG: hypothetical protein ACE5M4_01140 [Anaerolineales bacterium]